MLPVHGTCTSTFFIAHVNVKSDSTGTSTCREEEALQFFQQYDLSRRTKHPHTSLLFHLRQTQTSRTHTPIETLQIMPNGVQYCGRDCCQIVKSET